VQTADHGNKDATLGSASTSGCSTSTSTGGALSEASTTPTPQVSTPMDHGNDGSTTPATRPRECTTTPLVSTPTGPDEGNNDSGTSPATPRRTHPGNDLTFVSICLRQ